MIERYVFVKLKEPFAIDLKRLEVLDRTIDILRQVPGVRGLRAGLPGDEKTTAAWDLCIVIKFQYYADIQPYLDHPIHRTYVDEYLTPMMEHIRAWNFEVQG